MASSSSSSSSSDQASGLPAPIMQGASSKFMKLVSIDGHEFIVHREYAYVSKFLHDMIENCPVSTEEGEEASHTVPNLASHVLDHVCVYFNYKTHFTESVKEIPEFDMPVEMALEMLMAANFLDC